MRNKLQGLSLLLVPALTACTLGPDYLRPPASVPEHWKEAAPSDDAIRGDWWSLFKDPDLAGLESKALAANQTLAAAVARATEAAASLRAVASQQFPDLSSNPSAVRERTYTSLTPGSDAAVNRNLFTVPFNLSYEIDVWGRVRRSIEASKATYEASLADLETVRLGITSEVAQTWFMMRHIDLERRLLEETVELRKRTLGLVETRFRNGIANELEVAQAGVELAQAESDVAGLERTRAQLEHALAQLTGEPASSVSLSAKPLDGVIPSIPVILPSALLERRPDIAQAERLMAAANARIGIAQTAYYPSLNLAALAGFESIDLSRLFHWSNRIWSMGGASSVPLFEGGRLEADVEIARAQYDQAVAAYRQRVLGAFQEVEDALASLRSLSQQAAAQDRLLKAAQQGTALAKRRYEEGLASLLELVDTQRSLLQAQRGANIIYRDRLLAGVFLLRALGGGWVPGDGRIAPRKDH
jgi:multidrug efflux system outer membrane protein